MDHAGRLRRLSRELEEKDIEFLLVTHLPNVRYLCGFTGSAAALLVTDRSSVLFTDARYRTQAKEEVSAAQVVIAPKAPGIAAAEWLVAKRGTGSKNRGTGFRRDRIGIDQRWFARPAGASPEREGAPAFHARTR